MALPCFIITIYFLRYLSIRGVICMNNDKKMVKGIYEDISKYTDDVYTFSYLVKLKIMVSFDFKDRNNIKMDFINAYRYSSNKYSNKTKLIKIVRKFKSYLVLEYPADAEENVGKKLYYFCMEDMLGIIDICKRFDKVFLNAFAYKKDKLILISENVERFEYMNIFGQSISFIPALFKRDNDTTDTPASPGVQVTINEKFSFICSVEKWKGFLYNLIKCDLYGWGATIANNVDVSIEDVITEIDFSSNNDNNQSEMAKTERDNDVTSVSINRSKPFSKKEKIDSFFDD